MGDLGQSCVRGLMFTFNFVFWIIGIALIAAGAVAVSHYKTYVDFLDNGTNSAAVLLIVVGVFIFIISFLGCWGSARESYPLLMGFAVVIGIIFVLQLAGGIAGFVEKEKISGWVKEGVNNSINEYKTKNGSVEQKIIDDLQKELSCCGADGFKDWMMNNPIVNDTVPSSCCINETICDRNSTFITDNCGEGKRNENCPINTKGCVNEVDIILKKAVIGVAGVAIGLAFIEVVGMVFACYLAKRIRSGYTYA
jgi:CD63 antigen